MASHKNGKLTDLYSQTFKPDQMAGTFSEDGGEIMPSPQVKLAFKEKADKIGSLNKLKE